MSRAVARLTCASLLVLLGTGCDGLTWILEEPPGPPEAPLLADIESPTRQTEVVVNGNKAAGTAVRFAGEEILPLGPEISFQHIVTLVSGENTLSFTVVDSLEQESEPAELVVVVDDIPPAAPTVEPIPAFTESSSVTLRGTREPDSAVWINGDEAAAASATPTWEVTQTLDNGPNTIRVSAYDEVGNESTVVELSIIRTDADFMVDPVPALVPAGTFSVTGTRSYGVAVELDGTEVLAPATTGGAWSIDVPLTAGSNTFTISGVFGDERWDNDYTVVLDDVAPGTPTVTALPALSTSPIITLSGSLPDAAALVVNGEVVLDDRDAGPFSVDLDVGYGAIVLTVLARDNAGNSSAAVDPAPTTYVNPAGVVFELDPVPSTVLTSPVTLTGVRGPDVSVYVDDILYSSPGSTTFSVDVPVVEGTNLLVVEGRVGPASEIIMVDVTLAPAAPGAPTMDSLAISTDQPSVDVSGMRPADTAVLRNGVQAVPAGAATAFIDTVTVPEGVTVLAYALRDSFGRTGPAVDVTITYTPVVDAGVDAGIIDAGYDAGIVDAGYDAGPYDAGPYDAGPYDAGLADGGAHDAGVDAGDAG
jgi:hypothetical protein